MTAKIEQFKNEEGKEFIRIWSPYNARFVQEARNMRGKFNVAEKAWEFPIRSKSKVDAVLFDIYGTTDGSKSEKVDIILTFNQYVKADCDSIRIAGRTIARGISRDSGAECGAEVTFESGEIGTDGSRKNWFTYIGQGSVFEVFGFEKAALAILDKNDKVSYTIIEE